MPKIAANKILGPLWWFSNFMQKPLPPWLSQRGKDYHARTMLRYAAIDHKLMSLGYPLGTLYLNTVVYGSPQHYPSLPVMWVDDRAVDAFLANLMLAASKHVGRPMQPVAPHTTIAGRVPTWAAAAHGYDGFGYYNGCGCG